MSNHPEVRSAALQLGLSENADVDLNGLATAAQLRMVVAPPNTRVKVLEEIDKEISKNDGTTLRQKTELVTLRRRLS